MKTGHLIFAILGVALMIYDAIGIFQLTQLYLTVPSVEGATAQLIDSLNFTLRLYGIMFVVGMFMAFFGWDAYKSKQ